MSVPERMCHTASILLIRELFVKHDRQPVWTLQQIGYSKFVYEQRTTLNTVFEQFRQLFTDEYTPSSKNLVRKFKTYLNINIIRCMLLAVRKNIHTIVEHNLQTVACERQSYYHIHEHLSKPM
ncbi:uncharacterized protein LOC105734796 isoform X1 [Apis florea]|uniref:uncharacterized protein LOC105734796 isoform X1 n=1 Tax=Apis florea TaxID=7463 RepID=UPI0012FF151B|nr:uncharacterized protein LOC105734796 isoform X1 [Apis florea]